MSYDPMVCVHKIDAMQLIQDLVSHGYSWWIAGEVEANRASAFVSKMDELYGVGLDRNRRARRAARGECNAYLVLYPKPDATALRWWLLATDGQGEIRRREKMTPLGSKATRLEWRGYELVRLTFKMRKKSSWTWRMTQAEVEGWHARLKRAGSSQNPILMEQAIHSLYRAPGFAGIRQQIGYLMTVAREEWKAGHAAQLPKTPSRLLYLRKRIKEQQPLSALVRRASRSNASWFGTVKRSVLIAGDSP